MASEVYLVAGSIVIVVFTLLVEEGISFVIRRAAKLANVRPSVARDAATGLRIVAILVIVSAVLGFTGLSSEFTSLTISGIAALAALSRPPVHPLKFHRGYLVALRRDNPRG